VRTVAGSVGYIRSSVGGIGIVVVILITLPVFVSLMLVRINIAVGASFSDMLGCERETQVLKQASSLVNILIALVALSAFMFVYFLTLLLKCSSAYA
jgi:stage III sporulation protein AE